MLQMRSTLLDINGPTGAFALLLSDRRGTFFCIFLTTRTICIDKKMIFSVYQQQRLNFICRVSQYSWYLDNTCQVKSYRMDDRFWIHSQP